MGAAFTAGAGAAVTRESRLLCLGGGVPPSGERPQGTPRAPRLQHCSGDAGKLGGRSLLLRPPSPVLEAGMMGDRASGGTAAVTCGVRCHPQLFTPGSQVPQRPRGNRGTGEASQPGGRQGSLEPPLHSQRGRQSLSARPPGELRPSPRPEAGPSSAPASKGPPCGLQPPPGRQRSGALQVVAQPPAQIRKGSPSRADGDAPHLPARHQGAAQPCRCGSWTSAGGRPGCRLART